uniref:HEAT repeat domain-containing protein n=1 Tax=Schlesneria paludicola TaxID=360056 RepID=A0A7C4LJC9_9PLAN
MIRAAQLWLLAICLTCAWCALADAQDGPAANAAAEPEPSPLLSEPQTPEQMFAAAVLLVDLARFDLAKIYLTQLVQSDPSDELLLRLRDQHGTGEFLRLSRVKELNPPARTLLDKLDAASRRQAQDPVFVERLVAQLFTTPVRRELAIRELRNAGPVVVPEMLRLMTLRENPADQDTIVLALVGMGRQVVPVLLGAMQSPVASIRNGAIEALRLLKAAEAVPFLWSLGFSPGSDPGTAHAARRALASITLGNPGLMGGLSASRAVDELRSHAWGLYTRQLSLADPAADGQQDTLTIWRWDSTTGRLRPEEVRREQAELELATQLSREALLISPDRSDLQRLHLGTLLATEIQRRGWEQPLSPAADGILQAAISSGESLLLDVLRDALQWKRTDAAWAALQALNQIASREVLQSGTGDVSPVLDALNYPDPRVQFAAAIVTLRAEPRASFPSASRVLAILRRALTDPGRARALVIDSDQDRATTLGGYLFEQGYDPVTATTGREGFTLAAENTGIELVVIHANVVRWDLTQTVANFRADARTAFLPLVIYGPDEARPKTQRLIARNQPAMFAGDSPAAAAFWEQVLPFVRNFRTPPMSGQQRAEFKALAADWLATIANGRMAELFDVRTAEAELLALIEEVEIVEDVLSTLVAIPSRNVQTRLAEFTINSRLPRDTRLLAANHLAAHINRFGLVLSADDVQSLKELWTSTSDVELQVALAGILGALKPSAGLIGERLRRVNIPAGSAAP